ncbi:MAG: Flp pilus assembly complex ATPase component TadA [Kiritimatiellae bacterium]|nr:Flp pilus assembly complex ATPase component TadA [Kiritimatiellia bacterium]
MTSNDDYVLQLLQEEGMVTQEQIDEATSHLAADGSTIVDQLITDGAVSEENLLAMLATQFGMDFVNIDDKALDTELASVVSAEDARKYGIVPLLKDGDSLTVAVKDPLDYGVVDRLSFALKCSVTGVVATKSDIDKAIERLYPGGTSMDALLGEFGDKEADVATRGNEIADQLGITDVSENDAPVIRLVSLIIMEAFKRRASDIHLEPLENRFRIRYRIDGALQDMDPPPKRLQPAIIQRIKIQSGMKISEKRIPQDGRIQVNAKGRDLDLRVSSVPTNHGESIVMRILDKQNLALGLPELGFLSDDQQKFEQLLGLSDGVLLVTGPTGSGKTTTLYACLGQMNTPNRKIITVEDPVEYQMTGVNQVQVNRDVGLDFSAALRSILRQAPNVVMIGEIRDNETADIAMEAALTGHLVFSTLHTNDAPSAITRLVDIGVKPYLVASAVRAVMAQRLVRCICKECKVEKTPTDHELKVLGDLGAKNIQGMKMYSGKGCAVCSGTGYKGRKGIFEIFTMSDEIQRMIFEQRPAIELRAIAREMGMRSLREDGLLKVASGMTSLEEVLRVTMGDAN